MLLGFGAVMVRRKR
ncbi:MAG: hypothetical protein ACYS91_17485 [Planctomycetota bacterium]